MTSKNGYHWTPETGLSQGLTSEGVIQPPQKLSNDDHYDVIVIGAGYCGLTAARDMCTAGLKVLLLEARDRIGGRTWSTNIEGYIYDLGGSWVHWAQPHVWREIFRYDKLDELRRSTDLSYGVNYFRLRTPTYDGRMSHDDEDEVVGSGLRKFVNVDGAYGQTIMPYPYRTFDNPALRPYDHLTLGDRLRQIEAEISPNERAAILGYILTTSGGSLETTSFVEFLHWWAMCNYTVQGFQDCHEGFQLQKGQSAFARLFFEEALRTGNLSYAFDSPVQSVVSENDNGDIVVTVENNQSFKAARAVCTAPLNTLSNITFTPPLNETRAAAIRAGHVNKCTKIYAEVDDKELRSWGGINYPDNKLIYSNAVGATPAGYPTLVCFGPAEKGLQPEEDIEETLQQVKNMDPGVINPRRLVFHNWVKDPYSRGAWFYPPPGLLSEALDALRERHGNVLFASADWARGWRGFIDGAIEDGTRAAIVCSEELLRGKKGRIGFCRGLS
ncbi:flavin monoamine oxidase family protein [Aspergillus homomorphus CBS 101889]|uniref:Amine oxidase n=1 Tax=Aspergillus homomorphus (strain CBS 101889) TaxID=1450537 RepID=A0A395I0Y4_ASPHC|nr:monoamine oxidase maoN [Aspergillus homomorphus CBS 101889]RAL13385.1 monoamine oxidase maoN [Aspergillus homomorphus CBS 101889]